MSLHRASLSFVSAITAITFAGSCTPVSGPSPKDALVSSKGKIGILRRVISMGTAGLDGVETRQKSDKKWAVMKVGGMLHKGTSLRIRRGVRVHLAMSDGSKLTLNEGSRLDLLGNRDFSLGEGEVLAEVAPDATRPLRIKTASGTLRITGTRLNVRVESEGTTLDVAKGTVEVEASGRKVSVGAGERAILREGQPPRVGLSGDLVGTLGWAREVIEAPARDVNQLRAGFGSLKARIPGRGTSEALSLSAQSVRVVVRGNIARTEVEQTFYNPSGSTLEGTYRFPLPAGASISRLALYVGDRLEEGEIVERRRARQIFARIVNDTIHPRDPALLEWVGGRTFRMKIFPIPPRASRRVILAYTQVLSGRHGRLTYVYPMESGSGRATRVGRFELKMMVHDADVAVPLFPVLRERAGGSETLRFEASDFSPAASFVASISQRKVAPEMEIALQGARRVIGHGNVTSRRMKRSLSSHRTRGPRKHDRGGFFMARLRPELPLAGRAKIRDYVFVLDRSYGMGVRGWRAENRAVEVFLSEMDVRSRFALLACDTRCDVMGDAKGRFTTPNTEGRERARRFLETMKPGGSSNLQLAFDEAARLAGRSKHAVTVIYLGDGRPTIGELREVALAQRVVRNLRAVKARLSVLQVGEDVGAIFLSQTTRKLGGAIHRLGQGDDLRRTIFEVVASQYQPTLTDLRVRFVGLPGIHHVYPRELPTITAGGEVVLVGRFDGAGHGAIRVEGRVDGRPFDRRYPVTFSRGDLSVRSNSFIPRLWAQRYIEALTVDGYAQGRPEIVRVSKAYTVLSRATAFLVLENERMYREFGVRRQRHRTTWKGAKGKSLALKDQAKAADGSAKGGSLRQEVASKKASESAHASGRGAVAAAPAASPRPSKSLDA
ncbi:MAG: FecR domain-containing protein, partial [Deltaproteobacteria bacterium]|nr:FecR domain-containing protein [Deltaproteobacteria bacterium]